jgi:two-component system cell cycle sensor histidine kinase/response regulator CckA
VAAIVATSRDITRRVRLGEHLASAKRMDALARLLDGIALEFDALVGSLSADVRRCLDGLAPGDPRREHAVGLQDSVRRLADLSRRLGTMRASRLARFELVELNDVVERFVSLVRRAMPHEVELDFVPGLELSPITADPALLEQLLMYLAVNARDALPEGGRITIATEDVILDDGYREAHPWAKPGRYVLLSVSDDGIGMAPDVRERAFEPLFTTKAQGRGAGLGLATVYAIVQAHGGMIHLESEIGSGTTVQVYLPSAKRHADCVGPGTAGAATGGAETLLVAEDEDDVRKLVVRLLSRAGYRVLEATDGAEAIRLFGEHTEVALVLLDVVMPNLRPDVKILFTSGWSERLAGEGDAVDPMLPKPYEPDRLLRMIRRVLDSER